MRIATKTGDKGKTSLLSGKRVGKDDIRIEVCGCLDELCSFLGLARSLVTNRRIGTILQDIQSDLFAIGSEVSSDMANLKKLKSRIGRHDVRKLEEYIDRMESVSGLEGRRFHLSGANAQSAAVDVARAMARRLERRIITLGRRGYMKNPSITIYLNRLSDLLFLMARSLE